MEQIQRDTRLRVDERIPAEQRTLFDYGGYFSLNYLSSTTRTGITTACGSMTRHLRRLNIDGVHEFYGSLRGSYRDYNPGDAFSESEAPAGGATSIAPTTASISSAITPLIRAKKSTTT